jgi:citrate lyase beta subunit
MTRETILPSPRRSLLFTPGDSQRKIIKAARLGADMVILDLEDSVDVSRKEEARLIAVTALADVDFGATERLVRINPPESAFFAADLETMAETMVNTAVAGIVVPKVETAAALRSVDEFLSAREKEGKRPAGFIRLFALIETALGIMNIKEIAQACPRLDGLLFGAEDLAADLGVARSVTGWEASYARSVVVTAAAAYDLWAVDTVFVDTKNLTGLEKDAFISRQLGYNGKMAIHPNQIEIINRVFSPTVDEIAEARRLLVAYQSHQAVGIGVFTLEGRMIDAPMVRSAERIMERATQCGPLGE